MTIGTTNDKSGALAHFFADQATTTFPIRIGWKIPPNLTRKNRKRWLERIAKRMGIQVRAVKRIIGADEFLTCASSPRAIITADSTLDMLQWGDTYTPPPAHVFTEKTSLESIVKEVEREGKAITLGIGPGKVTITKWEDGTP